MKMLNTCSPSLMEAKARGAVFAHSVQQPNVSDSCKDNECSPTYHMGTVRRFPTHAFHYLLLHGRFIEWLSAADS